MGASVLRKIISFVRLSQFLIPVVIGIELSVFVLFFLSSPDSIFAQASPNPWSVYNNPSYGNSLDSSLGVTPVDPPASRLHSGGNLLVKNSLILGTGLVNSSTWGARSFVLNSATNPWWIRGNSSDNHLAIGMTTDTSDSNIKLSITNTGGLLLPGSITFSNLSKNIDFGRIDQTLTGYTGLAGGSTLTTPDGVPHYLAVGREGGGWASPTYQNMVIQNHTGVRLSAHGGFERGGISFYEQLGPDFNWATASSKGTEIGRFRINNYGGSYFNSRLATGVTSDPSGATDNPATALDVNGVINLRTGGIDTLGPSANGARMASTPNLHLDSQDGATGVYLNYWGGSSGTYICDGSNGCNIVAAGDGILTLGGNYGRTTTTHAAGYFAYNYPYEMHYYGGSEFYRSYMDGNWSYVIDSQQSPVSGHILLHPKGNVGIGVGTTVPHNKLEVGNGSDGIVIGQVADNTQTIQTYIDNHWADRTTYASGCCNKLLLQPDVGDVGIGTTTPQGKFAVGFGNGDQLIVYQPYDDALAIQTTLNGQPNNGYGGDPPNRLILQPTVGYVGIGIANPSYKLHVGGTPGTLTGAVRIDGILALNGYAPNACSSGGVWGLCVGGASGGQSGWNNTSDARLKENIRTIPKALEKIMSLRGVYFNFKDLDGVYKTLPKGNQVGFIAQEVEPILPEVVSTAGDGMKMMGYGSITALLTEAIKEQQKQIEEEKVKNKMNQNEIEQLKLEIEQLKKAVEGPSNQKLNSQ